MALSPVGTFGPTQDNTTNSTVAYTLTAGQSIAVGELTVLSVCAAGNAGCTVSSVTDTKGNSYTVDVALGPSASAVGSICSMICTNALTTGDVITATLAHQSSNKLLTIRHYTGSSGSAPLDITASAGSATGSTTPTATSSPTTTSQANEVKVSLVVWNGHPVDTTDASYTTSIATQAFDWAPLGQTKSMSMKEVIVSSTGVLARTDSLASSQPWVCLCASYKEASSAPPPTVKAPPRGLSTRDADKPPSGYDGSYSNRMIDILWRDIQPTDTNALDTTEKTRITGLLNAAQTAGDTASFRFFVSKWKSGIGPPTWLSAKVGTFQYKDPQDPANPVSPIPKFWTPAFLADYERLWALMAAEWDTHPALRMIQIANAMTFYAEELIRHTAASQNVAELVGGGVGWDGTAKIAPAAGYTDALNMAALKKGIDIHATYFLNTPGEVACNPYSKILSQTEAGKTYWTPTNGQPIDNQVFQGNDDANLTRTKEFIDYMEAKLGPTQRLVLGNNSPRSSWFKADHSLTTGKTQSMYLYQLTKQRPMYFQCANTGNIGDFNAAMQGITTTLKANACEPPTNSGVSPYDAANFASWDTILKAQSVPTGVTNHVPFAIGPPVITAGVGGFVQGQVVTTSMGDWDPGGHAVSASGYHVQWYRQDPVTGARTSVRGPTNYSSAASIDSYTLAAGDVNNFIVVVATATNSDGTSGTNESTLTVQIVSSAPTAPTNTTLPTLSNTAPATGDTENADHGVWTGSPTSYTYQFEGTNDSGANWSVFQSGSAASFQTTSSHVGYQLRVGVTANNGTDSALVYSNPTTAVVAAVVFSMQSPTQSITLVDENSDTFTIQGTVIPREGTTVSTLTVNGNSRSFDSSGNFTVIVGVATGTNSFTLVATSSTGSSSSLTFVLIRNQLVISSDVADIELRFHQRGLQ